MTRFLSPGPRSSRPFASSIVLSRVPLALVVALTLAGCVNLAPDYHRPDPAVPRRAEAAVPVTTEAASLDWHAVFLDARLRGAVALALRENRDLRVAALQVEQARAAFRQTDAQRLPSIGGSATASRGGAAGQVTQQVSMQLALSSYELDFFGRVRNLSESAQQALLGADESRRSVRLTLVAETATAWLTWAADLERQRLAVQTLQSQERSLALTQRRHAAGAVSGLVLAQAETAVQSARADVAAYPATIAQDRNALELLLGAAVPAELEPRDADALATMSLLVEVPAGVPSSVLQRRPDVLAAERALIARHADIGAARAARFPSISLTASAGTGSSALSGLFKSGSGNWNFGPSASLPIFDGGAREAAVRQAEAGRDIALATYDKTLQTAFREVADALAVRATLADRLAAQQALLASSERQLRLAETQYRVGSTTQLDLLDAQRSLVGAQQALVTLRLSEQLNRITLYKVLGGGWREDAADTAGPAAAAE
ncbi:efflux transporter outer membrane subunit [Mitsuaria sp. GD03876]|uniref:efflux transporter outer membrane subunit n=1 Tax=Mitsuaria sp. GD03876 TaxID=2975399 RepID=UPI002449044C|nr:efflux transporter outer membrane subunit [Mitsuaria sp. GD03876]MDH0864465.1 efflux transporter outer membrane subunit [Mitsuaria sp. GD03876]